MAAVGDRWAIERLLVERRLDPRAERLLFAMVANRALAPFSKLACCEWLASDVAIPGLAADAVGEDPQPLYRAMDWLLEIEAQLVEQVYWATADLLNLEVDLLFFDTSSTYFERDEPDSRTGRGGRHDAPAVSDLRPFQGSSRRICRRS